MPNVQIDLTHHRCQAPTQRSQPAIGAAFNFYSIISDDIEKHDYNELNPRAGLICAELDQPHARLVIGDQLLFVLISHLIGDTFTTT
jgi:hypothetical protein